jgi:hypothetical protein
MRVKAQSKHPTYSACCNTIETVSETNEEWNPFRLEAIRHEIAANSCIAATLAMRLRPDHPDKDVDRL